MKTGKAWVKKGKIYFNEEGWALVKEHARKQHRSPKIVVIRGLRRGMKLMEGKLNARLSA